MLYSLKTSKDFKLKRIIPVLGIKCRYIVILSDGSIRVKPKLFFMYLNAFMLSVGKTNGRMHESQILG